MKDDQSLEMRPPINKNNIDDIPLRIEQGMSDDQKLWMRFHYNLKHLPNSYMW